MKEMVVLGEGCGVEEQFLICPWMPETRMYLNTAREDPVSRLKLQGKKK